MRHLVVAAAERLLQGVQRAGVERHRLELGARREEGAKLWRRRAVQHLVDGRQVAVAAAEAAHVWWWNDVMCGHCRGGVGAVWALVGGGDVKNRLKIFRCADEKWSWILKHKHNVMSSVLVVWLAIIRRLYATLQKFQFHTFVEHVAHHKCYKYNNMAWQGWRGGYKSCGVRLKLLPEDGREWGAVRCRICWCRWRGSAYSDTAAAATWRCAAETRDSAAVTCDRIMWHAADDNKYCSL